jgi:outer membrane murein-binding lipoprotein Lpp
MKMVEPSLELLKRRNLTSAEDGMLNYGSSGGGGSGHDGERLASIEGIVDGLKHVQSQLLVTIGVVSAVLIAVGLYTIAKVEQSSDRVERLTERVNELPSKMSADLRDLTRVLAESINAAKQTPPQIIVVPSPAPSPTSTPQK